MWQGVSPIPMQMWEEGRAKSRRRCGRIELCPSTDVAGMSPSPTADVAGLGPVAVQIWQGISPVAEQMWQGWQGCECRCGRA